MKHLFLFAAMLLSGVLYAQTPTATPLLKKKAEFYAAEAITYFKIDESKKNSIAEAKVNLMLAQKEMEAKKKAGELPQAEECISVFPKNNEHYWCKME
jgi:hypothetical protein